MAKGRKGGAKGGTSGRDGGGFAALPWSVLDCPAYAGLSHPARALLLEFARQFVRDNNGRLLASSAYLAGRGWRSNDVIARAKRELLAGGFIHETVKGHRPNRASWYAVTWQTLDKLPGYDPGAAELFKRSAYREGGTLAFASAAPTPARQRTNACAPRSENAMPRPSDGVGGAPIAPSGGVGVPPLAPSGGAMGAGLAALSAPSGGHHLEKPSAGVRLQVVPAASRARARRVA